MSEKRHLTIKATRTMNLVVALVGRQKLAGVSGQGGSGFDAPQGKLGALAGIVGKSRPHRYFPTISNEQGRNAPILHNSEVKP